MHTVVPRAGLSNALTLAQAFATMGRSRLRGR
jgi:hypothetical protein